MIALTTEDTPRTEKQEVKDFNTLVRQGLNRATIEEGQKTAVRQFAAGILGQLEGSQSDAEVRRVQETVQVALSSKLVPNEAVISGIMKPAMDKYVKTRSGVEESAAVCKI